MPASLFHVERRNGSRPTGGPSLIPTSLWGPPNRNGRVEASPGASSSAAASWREDEPSQTAFPAEYRRPRSDGRSNRGPGLRLPKRLYARPGAGKPFPEFAPSGPSAGTRPRRTASTSTGSSEPLVVTDRRKAPEAPGEALRARRLFCALRQASARAASTDAGPAVLTSRSEERQRHPGACLRIPDGTWSSRGGPGASRLFLARSAKRRIVQ